MSERPPGPVARLCPQVPGAVSGAAEQRLNIALGETSGRSAARCEPWEKRQWIRRAPPGVIERFQSPLTGLCVAAGPPRTAYAACVRRPLTVGPKIATPQPSEAESGDFSRVAQVAGQRETAVLGLNPVCGRGTAILAVIPSARCPCHDGYIEWMGYTAPAPSGTWATASLPRVGTEESPQAIPHRQIG